LPFFFYWVSRFLCVAAHRGENYRLAQFVLVLDVILIFFENKHRTFGAEIAKYRGSPIVMADSSSIQTVSVRGRYLYKEDGSRFFMKGIAFPVSYHYNETAWIHVLRQLKVELLLDEINAVRLYHMDPAVDYSGFFHEAERLKVYVLVPLTAVSGHGVLDRNKPPPACYDQRLYEYGVAALNNYLQYPNALAGIVGNEVMNSLATWSAAPCIKAYVRDLKAYMRHNFCRSLPLMYTAQDAGIGAAVKAHDNVRLTEQYLSCSSSSTSSNPPADDLIVSSADGEEEDAAASIDIFGVNVESWCSSYNTFELNEDGSTGSYYKLWEELHGSTSVLVFAEMGCPRSHYNRDNALADKTRDWKQIPVVLHEMSDAWSGFCAYAYDGNVEFRLFSGGPWNGRDPLQPTDELTPFRNQLAEAAARPTNASTIQQLLLGHPRRPTCASVEEEMKTCCDYAFTDLKGGGLYDYIIIPSYFQETEDLLVRTISEQSDFLTAEVVPVNRLLLMTCTVTAAVIAILVFLITRQCLSRLERRETDDVTPAALMSYGSID
jgi:hypothetical protein